MRILRFFGRVISFCLSAILALLLLFNLTAIVARQISGNSYASVLGFTTAVVISGSMQPEIAVNDMVVIREMEDYAVNDVITYVSGSGSLITHRIVDEDAEGYITKGDYNNTVDTEAPISKDRVVGKVVLIIPALGLLLEYLKTPLGLLCITVLGFLLVMAPGIMERRYEDTYSGDEEDHEA